MQKKILCMFVVTLLIAAMFLLPLSAVKNAEQSLENTELITNVFTNNLNGEWNKTYGGSGQDWANFVQQTIDGGYIITGRTESFGAGGFDVWLIKTDTEGNMIWNKTFGGTKNDWGNSVQQTAEGGYILTGLTCHYNDLGSLWLIKTDTESNMIWNKTYGGFRYEEGNFVQQTSDGGYIIGGAADSMSVGQVDAWLIKTDNNGNMIWDKAFGYNFDDYCHTVQQTTDGGYILIGEIRWGTLGGSAWLIKTDNNGNMIWHKYLTNRDDRDSYGFSGQQTSDGGYIIAGCIGIYPSDAVLFKAEEGEPSAQLEIVRIIGGLGISIVIKNNGLCDASNIEWGIHLTPVFGIVLTGKHTTGTIQSLPSGRATIIRSNLIFGYGTAYVRIYVERVAKEAYCTTLGPVTFII